MAKIEINYRSHFGNGGFWMEQWDIWSAGHRQLLATVFDRQLYEFLREVLEVAANDERPVLGAPVRPLQNLPVRPVLHETPP